MIGGYDSHENSSSNRCLCRACFGIGVAHESECRTGARRRDDRRHRGADSATTTIGSTVRTSATGRALIAMPSKQLTLDHETTLVLYGDERGSVNRVRLVNGGMWSRVAKIFEQGEYYEVETETMVAAVRGTAFNVTYRDGVSAVMVTESTVAVTPRDEETGAPRTEASVLVIDGQKVVQEDALELRVDALTEDDRADSWFEFNTATSEPDDADSEERSAAPLPSSPAAANTVSEVRETVRSETRQDTETEREDDTSVPVEETVAEPILPPGIIVLANVSPARIARGSGDSLTIRGLGLSYAAYVSFVGEGEVVAAAESFKIVDDTAVTVTVPRGLAAGTYTIVVTSNAERGFSLKNALTLF